MRRMLDNDRDQTHVTLLTLLKFYLYYRLHLVILQVNYQKIRKPMSILCF